jgi:hypothetical protein
MATRLSLKYGAAAVVVALAIIGTSLYANTLRTPGTGLKGQTNFLVMLTDPPNVPRGTTQLNVTYSSIQLHVVSSDGTSNWVAAQASGRVNLLSLVNVTQTIANLNLPTGSTVDKIQFTISSAKAKINGEVYPVTMLTEQLQVSIRETKLNGTRAGALIDLRPTLVQINATNSTGGTVSYYVLVPSATAIVKSNVHENQSQIGTRSKLEDDDNEELDQEYHRASNNVIITQSILSVSGNVTTLTITVKNNGEENVTISGFTVHGNFTVSPSTASINQQHRNSEESDQSEEDTQGNSDHPDTIPFKISGSSLVPLFGDQDHEGNEGHSRLELKPGQSTTLTFSGVIQLHPDSQGKVSHVAITPVKGGRYTIRVMSEGSQTFDVTAS